MSGRGGSRGRGGYGRAADKERQTHRRQQPGGRGDGRRGQQQREGSRPGGLKGNTQERRRPCDEVRQNQHRMPEPQDTDRERRRTEERPDSEQRQLGSPRDYHAQSREARAHLPSGPPRQREEPRRPTAAATGGPPTLETAEQLPSRHAQPQQQQQRQQRALALQPPSASVCSTPGATGATLYTYTVYDIIYYTFLCLDLTHKDLPLRPNFGREGRRIRLHANHFALEIPTGYIYHYDVEITPSRCPSYLNRQVMQAVEKKYGSSLGHQLPVFDGKKNLYSRNKLPMDRVSSSWGSL